MAAGGRAPSPRSRWSAVLWDIDGTLVNSTDLAWSSTNLVLKQNGFREVSEDEYREATRLTTPKRLAFHATKDVEADIGVKLAEEFDRHYVQLVSPATVPLFSRLQTLLEDLAKEGVVLGALSNACGAYVRAVLATHGWAETFRTKLGADEVPEAKPAPGGLLKCCEILALHPASCVYVGDSPGDGKAAKAAGLYSVSWLAFPVFEIFVLSVLFIILFSGTGVTSRNHHMISNSERTLYRECECQSL